MSQTKRLRELLSRDEPLVVPGVYDPLSAKIAARFGFQAIYLGGFSAAAQRGIVEPFISLTEQAESARLITKAIDLPLITDGHSGFGDPVHVTHAVREFERAGVAAIHIEDALHPKRVHYHRGMHHVIDTEEMVAKIRFARLARQNDDFVIIARTEARAAHSGGLDETRSRLEAYAKAGADALIPQVWDPEEARLIGREFGDVPLVLFSLVRRQRWRELSIPEAHDLGFKVIIFPVTLIGDAAGAVISRCARIQELGMSGVDGRETQATWDLIDEVLGLDDYYRIEAATTEFPQRE